jgi:signal transduction histidine kinase
MSRPASRILAYRTHGPTIESVSPDEIAIAAEAREVERRHIARELHDTVLQPLASLVMSFTYVDRQPLRQGVIEAYMGAWRELAQEALDSLRSALIGMRTHPHALIGLPEAVYRYLGPQVRSRGMQLTFECRDWPADLPIDWTSHLYLVVREALSNVEKHAHASEVTVVLEADAKHLYIIVSDNGVGFRRGSCARGQHDGLGTGLGINGMRDRVRMLGGRLDITAAPGTGVRLKVRLPRPEGSDLTGTKSGDVVGGAVASGLADNTSST